MEEQKIDTILKWCLIITMLVLVNYFAIKYLKLKLENINKEEIKIVEREPELLEIWRAEEGNVHFLFHPYFLIKDRIHFNNIVLNKYLKKNNDFFKLWIVNFDKNLVSFDDSINKISIISSDKKIKNESIGNLLDNIPEGYKLFFEIFCKPGDIEANSLKSFLISFPAKKDNKIEKVILTWNGKELNFNKYFCLRKEFDEYINKPNADFWKK